MKFFTILRQKPRSFHTITMHVCVFDLVVSQQNLNNILPLGWENPNTSLGFSFHNDCVPECRRNCANYFNRLQLIHLHEDRVHKLLLTQFTILICEIIFCPINGFWQVQVFRRNDSKYNHAHMCCQCESLMKSHKILFDMTKADKTLVFLITSDYFVLTYGKMNPEPLILRWMTESVCNVESLLVNTKECLKTTNRKLLPRKLIPDK